MVFIAQSDCSKLRAAVSFPLGIMEAIAYMLERQTGAGKIRAPQS